MNHVMHPPGFRGRLTSRRTSRGNLLVFSRSTQTLLGIVVGTMVNDPFLKNPKVSRSERKQDLTWCPHCGDSMPSKCPHPAPVVVCRWWEREEGSVGGCGVHASHLVRVRTQKCASGSDVVLIEVVAIAYSAGSCRCFFLAAVSLWLLVLLGARSLESEGSRTYLILAFLRGSAWTSTIKIVRGTGAIQRGLAPVTGPSVLLTAMGSPCGPSVPFRGVSLLDCNCRWSPPDFTCIGLRAPLWV